MDTSIYLINTFIAIGVFVVSYLLIAVGLYRQDPSKVNGHLVALLAAYLFCLFVQSLMNLGEMEMIAFSFAPAFLPIIALVYVLRDLVWFEVRIARYLIVFCTGVMLALGLMLTNEPFWAIAFPVVIGTINPLGEALVRVFKHGWSKLTYAGKVLWIICLIQLVHDLTFPILRPNGPYTLIGFAVSSASVIASCFMAMAAVLEKTAIERTRSEAMALLQNRFFVNLSHEFRTPLTLILGPIRDVLDGAYGQMDDRLRGQFTSMHRAADRLHRLINQLLDLARLEAGGMRLEARAGDVGAFVRALTLSFASRAEREGKTLLLEPVSGAIEVYFDRDKLEKIVYNLLSNAFKFTGPGGKIRVAVDASDGSARIVVRDTGVGIPLAELPHIFDRFHQADASPTRRHEGSGIGLALAKELSELHHGTLTVQSEEGFGSTFTLTLPLGRSHLKDEELIAEEGAQLVAGLDTMDSADNPERTPSAESTLSNPAPLPTATILLVEDNADVRAYLKSHLLAYHILEAEDGEAGLALALSALPDLVISDVMMPRLDGYGLCAALRKDKRTQDIPVLLLTAKAAEENKIEGLKVGADDYLYKPFSARELLARTENLIHRNQELKKKYRQEVVLKPTEITVTSADAAFLEKVRAVVESGMGDSQFGVEQLAEEVGLGRRQLQRKMHELTQQTVHRYIQEIRLDRARQLLEQKAGNVSEVAYKAGFRDPRHFARLFQQKYGRSPSRWG